MNVRAMDFLPVGRAGAEDVRPSNMRILEITTKQAKFEFWNDCLPTALTLL